MLHPYEIVLTLGAETKRTVKYEHPAFGTVYVPKGVLGATGPYPEKLKLRLEVANGS